MECHTNKIDHSKSIISHTLYANVTLNPWHTADSIKSLLNLINSATE
jgi:hypothetical protein